jgi:hypothetical protein
MLRSRSYLGLLVLAATIGLPVSAVADGFVALASYLQNIFTTFPTGRPGQTVPAGVSRRDLCPRAGDDVEQAGYLKRPGT